MKRFVRIVLVCLLLAGAGATLLSVSHRALYRDRTQNKTHSLTILTYNTHRMGMFKKANQNEVIHYLQQVEADVLCLQEVEVYKDSRYLTLPELKQAMAKHYPYTYFDFKVYNSRRQFGNVVFSRYPLINKQTLRYDSRSNISSRCDIVIKGDTLRLITNHLESYRLKEQDFDSIKAHPLLPTTPLREKIWSSSRQRWRQARLVHRAAAASPYPVLVVGDMNAIPVSLTYLTLRLGLRDAFLSTSNLRLGNTFKRGQWRVRIDYILHSNQLAATACQVEQVTASDHLPVKATLVW